MKSLLYFFLFSITICFYIIPAIQSQCEENQQLSLLHLKKSLIFDSSVSSKLIFWNSSVDCCSWVGVTCSAKGRVVGLDISGEFISSSIDSSSSLFHLQHLQSLNLACNDFNGSQIPAAIGKLTNLKYLNLSSAEFFGQIPIEISKLTRLVILDISENFSIRGPLRLQKPNLSMLVQNLTQLTELYLDVVQILAEGIEWCQAITSSLPNLRVLSLSDCALSGPFHESLAELQSLSVVRLANNRFFAPVPGFFANFPNLTSLSLCNSQLQGTFPDEILQVPSLQAIDITNNLELHGSLPQFSKNNSLRSLVVRETNFSGLLPESIGNLRQLSTIDISGCDFTGSIPRSVGNLTQLVQLKMSGNKFDGPIDSIHWENLINLLYLALDSNLLNGRIPTSIFSPPLLEELLLSHNQFSGQVPKISNISSKSLNNLDLSRNNLEGPISASLLYLRGLRQLNLSSNNFSGFPFIGPQQLENVKDIDLSHNSLLICSNVSNSSSSTFLQIEILNLSSNKLRTFPHMLRNLSRLYHLDLSENQMQGKIPKWIWGVGSLQHLNVSCNSLVTVEAPSLNSASFVSELDLHLNQFQGQIPIFLPFATYLDYSRNHFSSSIPIDIGTSINSISFISLSRNKLYGTIPESICNISSYLEVLDLSHNSLSGLVPECLTTMDISSVLNLRGNNLTGTIPDTFLEDCSLIKNAGAK
ncbi:putative leucine-rich repeat-containing, plant-type, leucine-rich repeat domain, L [Rosa chinensis]|uniref:Putative leucine-rich repeat-containing, plant-type, leucine-rich repeat domain, L n=1 Tax=Rosa chinensis TaxID=74649 RepID=A0A2P6QTE9_ROSCH|nr:receptor-like protein 7 isoform X1 [Rosa chinensis]PRQ37462.1 putative leucine-rich repeat-containing, plant-type, leucine-rich repeat domain, L [Rosa chinensis]